MLPTLELIILILVFFATSILGVVTGSNSLITVPVMFQFGIDPKVAVATNMFGLTFMNIGATIPFVKKGTIDYRKVGPLVLITLVSSSLGALLVGLITGDSLKLIVSLAMVAVALFVLLNRDKGVKKIDRLSRRSIVLTFVLTFLLGIYGGLYSGGYVTVLTAVFVAFFGMTFTEAVASTKFINVFSSLVASLIFMWQGLVDYKLGAILAAAMFIGAYIGAHTATKLNDVWLKRIFLSVVLILAVKTLFDYI
ncbi:MAG: sulfite exporter TauE/SafE family protein [Pyrinomonadaceae bacterium]|nr:sulfite exporter TauE/SafE family protein [Pyrinomonadaceae bacterium]